MKRGRTLDCNIYSEVHTCPQNLRVSLRIISFVPKFSCNCNNIFFSLREKQPPKIWGLVHFVQDIFFFFFIMSGSRT